MPFQKGHKLSKGKKRSEQILPFSIKNIWSQWEAICEFLSDPNVSKFDKMSVHKWVFPLVCAYQFGKPTEKVEHSGDISININVVSK